MTTNDKTDKTSFLHIECNKTDKAGWVKTAQSEGLKLPDWVTKTLNGASKFKNRNK